MSADWRALSRRADLRPIGTEIRVKLHGNRSQVVNVEETSDGSLRLWSVTAKPGPVRQLSDPDLAAWTRNRLTELVGFYVDGRDRMIGETWLPTAGLTAAEWKFAVYNLARTCDRFEYLLTGRDED
jgi:hypothetical protein